MKAAVPVLAFALLLAGCDLKSLLAADAPTSSPDSRQSRALPTVSPTPRPTASSTTAPREAAWPIARPAAPTAEVVPDEEDAVPGELEVEPVGAQEDTEVAPTPSNEAPAPLLPWMPTPDVDPVDPVALFSAGVQRDLVGAHQSQRFGRFYTMLEAGQQTSIENLLKTAYTDTERVFMLKALIAGEPWEYVVAYGEEMRGQPEEVILAKSTMRDPMDLIQQWSDSCGPSLMQAIAGETDPRYAWVMNQNFDVTVVDPYGANQPLAQQQREWLEAYGGIATERGVPGGKGVPIMEMLNEKLLPLINTRYDGREVDNVDATLTRIAGYLEQGYDVPLRLSWSPPGSAEDSGHFLLALRAEGGPGAWRILVHDSFTGKTEWIEQSSMQNDMFEPIFTTYARLTHYYEPTSLD